MLFANATIATMHGKAPGNAPGNAPYGLVHDAALLVNGERIEWVGSSKQLPAAAKNTEILDLQGRLVTPGLIDCHTHIVHGGNRANEFEMRLNGASYEAIARAGGGIVSTVKATRETNAASLLHSALIRVDALISEGVTTIEIKSGYGLDVETELKMLQVAREISRQRPITVKTSFLGAHAVPVEYSDKPDAYLDEICLPALEAAHAESLADAVDGFCEGIAFTPEQIRKVFEKARSLGLPVKLHAEQLSNLGGTLLAAEFGALSADHLEYATEKDVAAMANAAMIAVILPGAYYTIRETQPPPIETFRRQGVPMALATDCNPGSSPIASLLLVMNMGCTIFRMTPEEALAGVTRNAALALGIENTGTLTAGSRADLAIWDVEHPAELAYRIGFNPLHKRVFAGRL